jgi:predicted nuclease with TOPRIM domain
VSKSRDKSPAENLRGQIRELESENRSLKKQIKALQKQEHIFNNPRSQLEEELEKKETCTVCGKGENESFIVAGRLFRRCILCGARSKGEKIG